MILAQWMKIEGLLLCKSLEPTRKNTGILMIKLTWLLEKRIWVKTLKISVNNLILKLVYCFAVARHAFCSFDFVGHMPISINTFSLDILSEWPIGNPISNFNSLSRKSKDPCRTLPSLLKIILMNLRFWKAL